MRLSHRRFELAEGLPLLRTPRSPVHGIVAQYHLAATVDEVLYQPWGTDAAKASLAALILLRSSMSLFLRPQRAR